MKYRVYLTLTKGDWVEVEAENEEAAQEAAIRESLKYHGSEFEYGIDDTEEVPCK